MVAWSTIGTGVAGITAITGLGLAGFALSGASPSIMPPLLGMALGGLVAAGGGVGFTYARLTRRAAQLEKQLSAVQRTLEQVAAESDVQRSRLLGLSQSVDDKMDQRAEALAAELKVVETLLRQMVDKRAASLATPTMPAKAPADSSHAVSLDVVRDAIKDGRIELHLQPVVRLPSRKTAHYEALSRLRDAHDAVILPSAYLPAAEQAGLVTAIDNLLLFRCINLIRSMGSKRSGIRLFVNLSPRSLADRDFIEDFIAFVRQHGELSERIVFEIAADDLARFDPSVIDVLSRLAKAGFAFSVDNIRSVDMDADALRRLNVQFVKIDASILMADGGTIRAEDVKSMLARSGLDLIVTRIETERDVIHVLELGADFGQGYLFGQPRPARATGAETTSQAA